MWSSDWLSSGETLVTFNINIRHGGVMQKPQERRESTADPSKDVLFWFCLCFSGLALNQSQVCYTAQRALHKHCKYKMFHRPRNTEDLKVRRWYAWNPGKADVILRSRRTNSNSLAEEIECGFFTGFPLCLFLPLWLLQECFPSAGWMLELITDGLTDGLHLLLFYRVSLQVGNGQICV